MKLHDIVEDGTTAFVGASMGAMLFDTLAHTVIASVVAVFTKELVMVIYNRFIDSNKRRKP